MAHRKVIVGYVVHCSLPRRRFQKAPPSFLFYFSLKQLQLIAWFYLLSSFHTHVRIRIWGPVSLYYIAAVFKWITIHAICNIDFTGDRSVVAGKAIVQR